MEEENKEKREQKFLTRSDVDNIEVVSSLKILRRSAKYLQKVSKEVGVDYQGFMDNLGLGEQKHSKELLEAAAQWNTLAKSEKNILRKWTKLDNDQKREEIKNDRGIETPEEIDKLMNLFNNVSTFFDGINMKQLEEVAAEKKKRDEEFNPLAIIPKVCSLFFNEYDDEKDEPGKFFKELLEIIGMATDIKAEVLINTDYKILLELLVRIILKPQQEANSSFFIEKAVSLFLNRTGLLNFIKTES